MPSQRLEEFRLNAREELIEAQLAIGRHSQVIYILRRWCTNSRFVSVPGVSSMLALYRCGRQAEALECFQRARRVLVEELGIEPGDTLRALEQAILRQDPELQAPLPPAGGAHEQAHDGEAAATRPEPALRDGVEEDAPSAGTLRKPATVLVARVSPRDRADPEIALTLVASARSAEDVISRHGGSFVAGLGGEWVWVFGLPVVKEDDALRAVRAAADLRSELCGRRQPERCPLSLRIGVATGELVAEGANDVFGEPLSKGVTLTQIAGDGDILLTDSTHALVAGAVRTEPAGGERTCRLVALDELPALRLDSAGTIVGRESELAAARAAFERARAGEEAHLLCVLGEAGIGKSRLAQELSDQLAQEALVLRGRCLSYGDGISFWPLREALTDVAGGESRAAIHSLIARSDHSEIVAGIVAGALGLAVSEDVGDQVPWAFRRVFEALAAERPLVLVLEDMHWAAPTLLELIDYLVDWLRAPVLLLCLARPELLEMRPGWGGGQPHISSLLLSRLNDGDARTLLDRRLGEHRLTAQQGERIIRTAEGNPLFVEQLLQASTESPWVDHEPPIPDRIQILLSARLDRLGPGERAFIARAATIGREFWPSAVVDLMPAEARRFADKHLRSLVRRGLIHPDRSTLAGEEQMRFHHILMCEVAYGSTAKALRAELHERFGDWLASRGGQFDEFVAYHLEQAYRYRIELGDSDGGAALLAVRAARSYAAAGRRTFSRGDVNGAVKLLRTSVALLDAGGEVHADVLIELGSALSESGDFQEAREVLHRALEHAHRSADERLAARASIAISYWHSRARPTGSVSDMRRVAETAIAVFERAGDHDGLSRAWHHVAWLNWVQSRCAEMESALERASEHADRAGSRRGRSQLLVDRARAAVFGPRAVADGLQQCRSLLAQAEGDVAATASIEAMLAVLQAMDGQAVAARLTWRRSKQCLQDLGLTFAVAVAQMFYAFVELYAGHSPSAEPEVADALAIFERCGDQARVSTAAALLACLLCAQGRWAEARQYSDLSRRTASDDDMVSQIIWRGAYARAIVHAGELAESRRIADSAVELALRTDFPMLQAGALGDRAEVLDQLGAPIEAARDRARAVELCARKGIRLPEKAAAAR